MYLVCLYGALVLSWQIVGRNGEEAKSQGAECEIGLGVGQENSGVEERL